MDIGVKFPDYREEIRDEALRFRALPPDEQVEKALAMVDWYYSLSREFGANESRDRIAERDEEMAREAIQRMVSRYA